MLSDRVEEGQDDAVVPDDEGSDPDEPAPPDPNSAVPIWRFHLEQLERIGKLGLSSFLEFIVSLFGKDVSKLTSFYFCRIFTHSVSPALDAIRNASSGLNQIYGACVTGLYLKNMSTQVTYVVLRYIHQSKKLVLVKISKRPCVQIKDEDFMKTDFDKHCLVVPFKDFKMYKPIKENSKMQGIVLGTYPKSQGVTEKVEIEPRRQPRRKGVPRRDGDAEIEKGSDSEYDDDCIPEERQRAPKRPLGDMRPSGSKRLTSHKKTMNQGVDSGGAAGASEKGTRTGAASNEACDAADDTGMALDDTGGAACDTGGAMGDPEATGVKDDGVDGETRFLLDNLSPFLLAESVPYDQIKSVMKALQHRLQRHATEAEKLQDTGDVFDSVMREASKRRNGLLQVRPIRGGSGLDNGHTRDVRGAILVIDYIESFLQRMQDMVQEEERVRQEQVLSNEQVVQPVSHPPRGPVRTQGRFSLQNISECKAKIKGPRQFVNLAIDVPSRLEKYAKACLVCLICRSASDAWVPAFNKDNRLRLQTDVVVRFAVVGNPHSMALIPRDYRENMCLEDMKDIHEGISFWKLDHVEEIWPTTREEAEAFYSDNLVDMCIRWDQMARKNLRCEGSLIHDLVETSILKEARRQACKHNIRAVKHNANLDIIESMTPEELEKYSQSLSERKKKALLRAGHSNLNWAGKRQATVKPPPNCVLILIPLFAIPVCMSDTLFEHYPPCSCHGAMKVNPVVDTLCHAYYRGRGAGQGILEFALPTDLLGMTRMPPACMLVAPRVWNDDE